MLRLTSFYLETKNRIERNFQLERNTIVTGKLLIKPTSLGFCTYRTNIIVTNNSKVVFECRPLERQLPLIQIPPLNVKRGNLTITITPIDNVGDKPLQLYGELLFREVR